MQVETEAMVDEYRYNRLTWPEMNDAIAQQRVVLLPTGSTEQHGPHLPLDTDVFLAESVCLEVGRRLADRVLVLPPVSYGLNQHHIDFPGTIHIEPETFIAFCLDIVKSVAYHGFTKIILVNGHGSNTPLIDLVARKAVLQTGSLCAAVNYLSLASDAFEAVRRDGARGRDGDVALPPPGGRARADAEGGRRRRPSRPVPLVGQHDERALQRLLGTVDEDGRARRPTPGYEGEG
jgi:creatinine amidohydrolase/Fe(II)-dependent formamide hydrolase-like protein